ARAGGGVGSDKHNHVPGGTPTARDATAHVPRAFPTIAGECDESREVSVFLPFCPSEKQKNRCTLLGERRNTGNAPANAMGSLLIYPGLVLVHMIRLCYKVK
ncbi:unnamed protein product, partial [Ectocarpus sp. 6 AP-2014]